MLMSAAASVVLIVTAVCVMSRVFMRSAAFAKQLKDNTRKIMEIFEATGQKNGKVVDYKIEYYNDFLEQMLEYGKKYSTL